MARKVQAVPVAIRNKQITNTDQKRVMMQINIGDRLKAAFGYVSGSESENLRKEKFSVDNGISSAGIYVSDSSFEEIAIIKDQSNSMFFGSMMSGNLDSVDIYAPPPMCSYSRSKNLIITEIDGTDAEVVERYGDKSWEIRLQGLLVDMKNHLYPKAQVIKFREFFEFSGAFAVEGQFFDDLNIKSIYFTDCDIAGVAGYADTIQYSLSARSIRPVEFFFVKQNIQ